MKLLIIGGTQFLGRAIVEAACPNGHDITLFNRGKSNPELFPDVEKLQGDRDGNLEALKGRKWDGVIDTCGYFPRVVEQSVEALKESVDHYTFISSISVYSEDVYTKPGTDEEGPVVYLEDETVEEITAETYGGLKVLCEEVVDVGFHNRSLIIRPGLIVGPYDMTDRFSYWPVRTARGGEMIVPPLDSPAQYIDVRDLAEWTLRMVEEGNTGDYNATGPDYALTFETLIHECIAAVGNNAATPVVVNEEFLTEEEVHPWTDLPLWLPVTHNGMSQVSVQKAINDGLTFRPVSDTVRATLTWYNHSHEADEALKAGLGPEREAEILKAWKEYEAN